MILNCVYYSSYLSLKLSGVILLICLSVYLPIIYLCVCLLAKHLRNQTEYGQKTLKSLWLQFFLADHFLLGDLSHNKGRWYNL
jgi:hypothetical protein